MASAPVRLFSWVYGSQNGRNIGAHICGIYPSTIALPGSESVLISGGLFSQLLNKVAGVYGLVAIFTGASFAQISLYIYSTLALIAFAWGLKVVSEVNNYRLPLLFTARSCVCPSSTGRPPSLALLCARLLRRPRPLHRMDCILCSCLVDLHAP